jgi:four helix bundle protein
MGCAANYVDLPCPLPPISREGFRKRGRADKVRYMNIAEGSIEECRYYLILAEDLGYGETKDLMEMLEEVSRLLNAYSKAILSSDS